MTKKEIAKYEALLTEAALRYTARVEPDILAPNPGERTKGSGVLNGYLYNSYSVRVEPSCTSSIHHSFGQHDKTTSHGARDLYSTPLLATLAMRNEIERESAKILRQVDVLIEKLRSAQVAETHAQQQAGQPLSTAAMP